VQKKNGAKPKYVCFKEEKQRSQPQKTLLVRVPVKMVSVTQTLRMTEIGAKAKVVCFGEDITGRQAIIPKVLSWVRESKG
jgi:hypothetical protein